MKPKLESIEIGMSDAESETNLCYFDEMQYLEKLEKNNRIFLILGEKGSGKSCLAKGYEKNQKSKCTVVKRMRDSNMNVEILNCDINNIKDNNMLLAFYKYYLLLIIAKSLFECKTNKDLIFEIIKHPIRWLVNKHKLNNIIKEQVLNYKLLNFNDTIEGATDTSINSSNVSVKYSRTNSYVMKSFQIIIHNMEECIKEIVKFIKPIIIFDEIEDYNIFKENLLRIESFIRIVKEVNESIVENHGRIIVVLKTSVFDYINSNSNNLNKIKEDCSIEVNWNRNYDAEKLPPLFELIMKKIIDKNEYFRNYSSEKVYKELFPPQVKNVPIREYIINATYGRPRDIIVMLNKIKVMYKDKTFFNEEFFANTRKDYSKYFFNELNNDLNTDLSQSDKDELFNIFRRLGSYQFDIVKLEEVFNNAKFEKAFTIDTFIDFCFEKNIIGFIKDSKYNWKYKNEGIICNKSCKFALHNGLGKYLLGR